MNVGKSLQATVFLMASTALVSQLSAATLYYTNFGNRQIYSLDTISKATTLVDNVPAAAGGNPDSLIFDSAGRLIYTLYNDSPGQIRIFNPNTNTDTQLATGFSTQLVDLTLEPSLTSVLVSDRGKNNIDRVDLASCTVTRLGGAVPSQP